MAFRRTKLAPGARVRLVAPSSPFPVEDFERGAARLSERYDVSYELALLQREGFLAGSDERRAAELQAAIDDAQVDAILAARGGYGATRLLGRLDLASLAAKPKLLVGFSDITALHALWARAAVGSLHGAMVAGLGRADDALFARWIRAVEGEPPPCVGGLTSLAGGCARGLLLGGNLSVLCALLGTPYMPPLEGAVLFLEDISERPYRVDRMLTTLLHSGLLARVSAVALGHFTRADPGPDGVSVESVLADRLGALGVPVVAGVPCGHVDDNLELPFGATVRVDAERGELVFEET